MATVDSLKGVPKVAPQVNSKSNVNDLIDKKMVEASTKAKGMLKNMPGNKTVEGAVAAAPGAAQAKGAARKGALAPQVAKQAMEAVGNKGGKVDRKA